VIGAGTTRSALDGTTRSALDAMVRVALDGVVDPCSAAMGVPVGLHEMGLVTEVRIDEADAAVEVRMRLTSPCCAYGPQLAAAARERMLAVDGVRSARVDIDHGAIWSASDIAGSAAGRLEVRRRVTRDLTGVRPFDWARWAGKERGR
jgi:metal-sulfur cluster biosynthetic enzyme